MEEYKMLIYCFLIAWFLSEFQPWDKLVQKLESFTPLEFRFITDALICFKCLSFWVTLFATFDIFSAILTSFLATTYELIFLRNK